MSEHKVVEFINEKFAIAKLTNYDFQDEMTPDVSTIELRLAKKEESSDTVFIELWNSTSNEMLYGGLECKIINQLSSILVGGGRNNVFFDMMIEALGGDAEAKFDGFSEKGRGRELKNRLTDIGTEIYKRWGKVLTPSTSGDDLPDFDADMPVKIPLFGFKILPDDTEILTEGFWAMKNSEPNLYVFLSKNEKIIDTDLSEHWNSSFEILPFKESSDYMFDVDMLPPPYTQEWLVSPKVFNNRDIPVNPEVGQDIFRELYNVIIPNHLLIETIRERKVLAYWIMASYFYDVFDAFPIGHGFGYYGSGKSRLAMLIVALAYHGQFAINLTSSDLFRTKEEFKPTLVIDENEENLRETTSIKDDMINGSYVRGAGSVSRRREVETTEGKLYVRDTFDLYSPTFFCSINPMRTPASRSRVITFSMVKKKVNFSIAERRRYKYIESLLYDYRFKMWTSARKLYNELNISGIPPLKTKDGEIDIVGRDHELWLPLFTVMKMIGRWDEDYEDVMKHLEWNKQYRLDADLADEERPTIYAAISKIWWDVTSKGYESPPENIEDQERWWYRHPNDFENWWEFKTSNLIQVMKAIAKETGYSKDINNKTVSTSLAMLNFERGRTGRKRNATFSFNMDTFKDTVEAHLGVTVEKLGEKEYDESIQDIKNDGNGTEASWMKNKK